MLNQISIKRSEAVGEAAASQQALATSEREGTELQRVQAENLAANAKRMSKAQESRGSKGGECCESSRERSMIQLSKIITHRCPA